MNLFFFYLNHLKWKIIALCTRTITLYMYIKISFFISNPVVRAIYSFRLVLFKKKKWTLTLQLMNCPIFQQRSTVSLCGTLQIIYIVQVSHCLCTLPSASFSRTIRIALIKYAPLYAVVSHIFLAPNESAILSAVRKQCPLYVFKQFCPLLC